MRNTLLLVTATAVLGGCVAPSPPAPQASAEQWIDEQIAVSATSLSQAQRRLHETSAQPLAAPATKPMANAPLPAKPSTTSVVATTVPATVAPAIEPATVVLPVADKPPVAVATPVSTASAVTPSALKESQSSGESGKVLGRQVGVLASLQPKPDTPSPTSKPVPVAGATAPVPPATPIKALPPAPKPPQTWPVSPQDKTIRETLAKWAAKDGWTFNPVGRQHWTVAEDFDVVASDTMYGTFIEAVQQLIGTTELTKTPLQPCFYSNHVVRVIYINEQCSFQTAQLRNP
jgi:hypothetical protein